MNTLINPLDRDALKQQFSSAKPYPHIVIENFLDDAFLKQVVASYPAFGAAWADANTEGAGRAFKQLHEKFKVQITDSKQFPEPVKALNDALASQSFLDDLAYITGIPKLLADPELRGGGMHLTGPRGRLDVHVDFNYNREADLHRRLNILIYLNPVWQSEWGGSIELWNKDVTNCEVSLRPIQNRCLLFETSEFSYHGVEPVSCPQDVARISFAGYYYTHEAPPGWDGTKHSTMFRSRPTEYWRDAVLGRLEDVQKKVYFRYRKAQQLVKTVLGR